MMTLSPQSPLIITGMHRSGTSLIARFVHHTGIDLGSEMLGALPSNPYGHFEDVEILNFHKQILEREYGDTMWAESTVPTGESDRSKALALLRQRQNKEMWGWKDPRTSLFLDFWHSLLPQANYLFIVRHPTLVVDSLARRTKSDWFRVWKHNRFLGAWLVYNEACYDFYRRRDKKQVMLVILEDILEAPDRFANALSSWLEIPFASADFLALYDQEALQHESRNRWLTWPPRQKQAALLFNKMKSVTDV